MWCVARRVCVLLFNPRTENEGIYTLQLRVQGGYINTVSLSPSLSRSASLLQLRVQGSYIHMVWCVFVSYHIQCTFFFCSLSLSSSLSLTH